MTLKVTYQFLGFSNASRLHLCSTLPISTDTPASRGPSATAGLLVAIIAGALIFAVFDPLPLT